MKRVYFVSSSERKFKEIEDIILNNGKEWNITWKESSLMEIQEDNAQELIRKKALEAFKLLKRPVLVEHTALLLSAFGELPGLHTDYFYSKVGYEWVVDYCNFKDDFKASAKSYFCLCDGKDYYIGEGEEKGEIIRSTKGIHPEEGFGWDIIFIPKKDNPNNETYARMEGKKNRRSMRKLAWENLLIKNQEKIASFSNLQTEETIDRLAELIVNKRVMLFVGAGISASVEFPSWKELIGKLGKSMGYEPDLFESYGEYMMLAEYAGLDRQEELHKQLCDTFQLTEEIREKLYSSRIYEILEKLDIPVIYTTNYDSLLEEYYNYAKHDAVVIKNIRDMQNVKPGIPRIMKFHGDLTNQDSVILSESKYFERMDFENFMDIQLQADMLQYSILFLGYSLSDINVKLLMYLAGKRCRKAGQAEKNGIYQEHGQAIQSYIYTTTPNAIQKEVFLRNNIITFSGENADKKEGTTDFLERLLKKSEELRGKSFL